MMILFHMLGAGCRNRPRSADSCSASIFFCFCSVCSLHVVSISTALNKNMTVSLILTICCNFSSTVVVINSGSISQIANFMLYMVPYVYKTLQKEVCIVIN